jgi:molybdenum cofactor cytidylyltransferase
MGLGTRESAGTAAVVLAAGFSSRFLVKSGQSKLAMPYGSTTVIGSVVKSATESKVDRVVVVTGEHREAVLAALPPASETAHNDHPDRGNISSLLVGLDAVGDIGAAIVLVGDMPDVDSSVIDRLLERWTETGAMVCVSTYTNGAGHPILIDQRLFEKVRSLSGAKPLWSLVESLDRASVERVEIDSPAPFDLNTNEDYLKALRVQGLNQD